MPAQRTYANPAVSMSVGRVALSRGPLVYCVEEIDKPGGTVQRLKLPRNSATRIAPILDLFGGTVIL
jgi:uncharacterized protein